MDAPYGESSEEGLLKAVLDLATDLDVAEMRELISERLSTDDVKNKAFERLYGELDRLKRHVSSASRLGQSAPLSGSLPP